LLLPFPCTVEYAYGGHTTTISPKTFASRAAAEVQTARRRK